MVLHAMLMNLSVKHVNQHAFQRMLFREPQGSPSVPVHAIRTGNNPDLLIKFRVF